MAQSTSHDEAADMITDEFAAEIADMMRAIPQNERQSAATYLCGVAQGLLAAGQIYQEKMSGGRKRGADDGEHTKD